VDAAITGINDTDPIDRTPMAILCGLYPRYLEWVERPVSALPVCIARRRAVGAAGAGINDTDPIDPGKLKINDTDSIDPDR
jgi:hypothetical protein